jgi:hypothetical protein
LRILTRDSIEEIWVAREVVVDIGVTADNRGVAEVESAGSDGAFDMRGVSACIYSRKVHLNLNRTAGMMEDFNGNISNVFTGSVFINTVYGIYVHFQPENPVVLKESAEMSVIYHEGASVQKEASMRQMIYQRYFCVVFISNYQV